MGRKIKSSNPKADFSLESSCGGLVCGIDEAGRAPLAGPVSAACVYIPTEVRRKKFWVEVNDSKKVAKAKRETLYNLIREHAAFGIAMASPEEIDKLNIHHATLLAMKRAFYAMKENFSHIIPDMALIDGKFAPDIPCRAQTVIGGDGISKSIAAASILAKVTRDRLMADLHVSFPVYGWIKNAGYPTPDHIEAIDKNGITPHHRRSFAPCLQQQIFKAAIA